MLSALAAAGLIWSATLALGNLTAVGASQRMQCVDCAPAAVMERSELTARGYRRFRCPECGKHFKERSDSPLNRTQSPSDVIALAVL